MRYSVHLSEIVGFQLRTPEICSWWNWRRWSCWFESSFKRISKTNWYVQWIFILNIIDFTIYFYSKTLWKMNRIQIDRTIDTHMIPFLDSQRYLIYQELLIRVTRFKNTIDKIFKLLMNLLIQTISFHLYEQSIIYGL